MVTQRTIVRTDEPSLTGQSADVLGIISAPSTANAAHVRCCAALNRPCVCAMSIPPLTPLVSHSAWDALAAPALAAPALSSGSSGGRGYAWTLAFARARGSLDKRLLTNR